MGLRIIRGSFHIAGYSPYGDSFGLQVKDPVHGALNEPRTRVNPAGHGRLVVDINVGHACADDSVGRELPYDFKPSAQLHFLIRGEHRLSIRAQFAEPTV